MDYFANSTEHLLAELERVDLLIQAQVARGKDKSMSTMNSSGAFIFPNRNWMLF